MVDGLNAVCTRWYSWWCFRHQRRFHSVHVRHTHKAWGTYSTELIFCIPHAPWMCYWILIFMLYASSEWMLNVQPVKYYWLQIIDIKQFRHVFDILVHTAYSVHSRWLLWRAISIAYAIHGIDDAWYVMVFNDFWHILKSFWFRAFFGANFHGGRESAYHSQA